MSSLSTGMRPELTDKISWIKLGPIRSEGRDKRLFTLTDGSCAELLKSPGVVQKIGCEKILGTVGETQICATHWIRKKDTLNLDLEGINAVVLVHHDSECEESVGGRTDDEVFDLLVVEQAYHI